MSAYVEDAKDRLIVWNGNADKRGALTPEFYQTILDAVEAAKDRRIRAIIITSQGGFFCAGGDLNALIERRGLPEPERREKVELLHDVIRAIRACPVPVIAAVKGGAAGLGHLSPWLAILLWWRQVRNSPPPMSKLDWFRMVG